MGGKIALATAIVVPFKAKIGETVPPVKGELRIEGGGGGGNDNPKSSDNGGGASVLTTRGAPGGHVGGNTDQAQADKEATVSMEAIMAAVIMDSAPASGGGGGGGGLDGKTRTAAEDGRFDRAGDGDADVENGRGGVRRDDDGGGKRHAGKCRDDDNDTGPAAAAAAAAAASAAASGRGRGRGPSFTRSESRRAGRERLHSAGGGAGAGPSRAVLQTVEEGELKQEESGGGSPPPAGQTDFTSPGCKEGEEGDEDAIFSFVEPIEGKEEDAARDAAPFHGAGGRK